MNHLKIAFVFTLLSFNICAQEKDSLGPNEYLYEFSMRYYGSESGVDPYYQYMLDYLVEMVQNNDSISLHVRGHVCCGAAYRLSKKRAKKTYKYLIRAGIDKTRISYKGYSNERPRAWPEKTKKDELVNRRVDFVIRRVDY